MYAKHEDSGGKKLFKKIFMDKEKRISNAIWCGKSSWGDVIVCTFSGHGNVRAARALSLVLLKWHSSESAKSIREDLCNSITVASLSYNT